MFEVVAQVIRLLDKGLDKLPAEQQCEACRVLELELARRRVLARAQARLAARGKRAP